MPRGHTVRQCYGTIRYGNAMVRYGTIQQYSESTVGFAWCVFLQFAFFVLVYFLRVFLCEECWSLSFDRGLSIVIAVGVGMCTAILLMHVVCSACGSAASAAPVMSFSGRTEFTTQD